MKRTLITPLIIGFMAISGCTGPQVRSGDELLLKETRERIERGEFKVAINTMEAFVLDRENHPQAGQAYYLAGTAARRQLDKERLDRGYSRIQNILSINVFPTEDGPLMEKAYGHFVKAGKSAGEDALAAEAMYLAATMMDVDYMKHFPDALKHYKEVFDNYPQTQWAEKARERYLTLQQYYKGITGSPYELDGP